MMNKMRIGFSAFFLGLFMVIGALYLDQIRGQASGSLGLYQIIAVIVGYMVIGIGLVMALQGRGARSVRNILLGGGGIIAVLSVMGKHIGVAVTPGFERFQIIGVAVGLFLTAVGFFLPQNLF